MSLGKNTKRTRINGGNDFQIKDTTWKSVGNILTGTIEDITDSQEITFADGNSIDIEGKRKVKVTVTLAQTSKEELELIDDWRDGLYPAYFYNGVVDGKKQAFYFKQLNLIPSMTIKSPDTPQSIVLVFTAEPQTAVFSYTPSSDFPAGSDVAGASSGTSKNKFYAIAEV